MAGQGAGHPATFSQTKYTYNGREYTSLDEMPPEVRAMFEDKDGDGLPDFINQMMPGAKVNVNKITEVRKEFTTPIPSPALFPALSGTQSSSISPLSPPRQELEHTYNKQERDKRPGFWARLFGKKKSP